MPADDVQASMDEASSPNLPQTKNSRSPTEALAAILESIPAENDGPRRINELCHQLGMQTDQEKRAFKAILTFLTPFEVLDLSKDASGELLFKASTRHALLFLRSYAAYLREGKSILTDWDRSSNPDGPYFARETLSGPEFLYLIERQRSEGRTDVIPLRETSVSQVIIKAQVRGLKGDAYLMQFDSEAQQFQLIGGHRRSTDPDDRTTAIRELQEELSKNQFNFRERDQLIQLATHDMVRMSRAFGVNTKYRFSFFLLKMPGGQLKLGPADRWVTQREIEAGVTREGSLIAIDALGALRAGLVGGLESLPLSLPAAQKRRLREIAREHHWEIAGLLIGILGIIITLVLFFFS